MARVVKATDDYPPRGAIDVDWFLEPPEHVAAWVAEDGASVAGHVALHSATDYVTTRLASDHLNRPRSTLGLIARLFVAPTHRGAGVGSALLARAATAAIERDLHPVLDVATHLTGAVSLYESVGWERVGKVVLDAWDGVPVEPPLSLYVYVMPLQMGRARTTSP